MNASAMGFWPAAWTTFGLLALPNVFMTIAWYGHLRNMQHRAWWVAALVSWGNSSSLYRLYRRVGSELSALAPVPDLVLWLRAPASTLLERIGRRGRAMERGIEARALDELDALYAACFARQPHLPVLEVDAEAFDFARRDDALVACIAGFRGPRGRHGGGRADDAGDLPVDVRVEGLS